MISTGTLSCTQAGRASPGTLRLDVVRDHLPDGWRYTVSSDHSYETMQRETTYIISGKGDVENRARAVSIRVRPEHDSPLIWRHAVLSTMCRLDAMLVHELVLET